MFHIEARKKEISFYWSVFENEQRQVLIKLLQDISTKGFHFSFNPKSLINKKSDIPESETRPLKHEASTKGFVVQSLIAIACGVFGLGLFQPLIYFEANGIDLPKIAGHLLAMAIFLVSGFASCASVRFLQNNVLGLKQSILMCYATNVIAITLVSIQFNIGDLNLQEIVRIIGLGFIGSTIITSELLSWSLRRNGLC